MWIFRHLCAMLIGMTLLVGAGVDVTLQVSVVNPPVLAPTAVTIPEGPMVNAVEAADGTMVIVGLPSGVFVGESVVLTITTPNSVVHTVIHIIVPADLVARTVTVTVSAGWLAIEGLYHVDVAMRAPDSVTVSSNTSTTFVVDVTPSGRPSLQLPEGTILSAIAAADGTPALVTLSPPTAVGDVVRLVITGPAGITTLSATLSSADVALGHLTLQIAGPTLAVPGLYSVTATVTDVAGNPSASSTSVSCTVEATVLVAPVIASVTGNGVLIPSGSGTTDRQPLIQGTAPVGSSVKIFANDAAIGTCIAAGDGTWSLTPPNLLGFRLQTLTAVATLKGVSTVVSALYTIDVLADEREIDVGGCGAGGGLAVFVLFGAFMVLRGGFRFRSAVPMLALMVVVTQAKAEEMPDQILTFSLSTWPAAHSSTATANNQTLSEVNGGRISLRADATWRFRQRDDEASPWLGFSVSVWRVRPTLVSTAPNDATFQVRLTGIPLDVLEHFRVVADYPWSVNIVPTLGAGPVLARIEGATVAGTYSHGSGTGYTLDAGLAVEPTYEIDPGWNLGATVRLVAARSDVRFTDHTTGGASESYHLTLVHLGVSAGALVGVLW